MTLQDVEVDKPFRVNRKFENGNLKDWTVFKVETFHSNNRDVLIYFRDLKQWVNPPTDTNQRHHIIKKIERYGVVYLKEGEEA